MPHVTRFSNDIMTSAQFSSFCQVVSGLAVLCSLMAYGEWPDEKISYI